MADLSITVASVAKGSGASVVSGTAGASITAGQALYVDTANSNVMKLADSDASTLAATVAGISLHAALTGQPIAYIANGPITIGATVTAGIFYAGSATAGAICPLSDLTTNAHPCLIGYASSATVIQVGIVNTGATL